MTWFTFYIFTHLTFRAPDRDLISHVHLVQVLLILSHS